MSFQSIHNYYEPLVIDYLVEHLAPELDITDENLLADIACLALNNLPARYIRHDVDMLFFLTAEEREQMQAEVTAETRKAAEKVLTDTDERQ
ncbi:MAG: late competence development ComFB family protein [Halochromatium sp.]